PAPLFAEVGVGAVAGVAVPGFGRAIGGGGVAVVVEAIAELGVSGMDIGVGGPALVVVVPAVAVLVAADRRRWRGDVARAAPLVGLGPARGVGHGRAIGDVADDDIEDDIDAAARGHHHVVE